MVKGVDPSTELMGVFRSNVDRHFSLDELAWEMTVRGLELTEERLKKILETLEGWRRIEREENGGEERYIFYDTTDFGCPRRKC
ncbi:MAG: hypothetical protein U9N44_07225 [Chloroflexota bacterium]|nr:hypothetical protein [Chloroflexota bacterium]